MTESNSNESLLKQFDTFLYARRGLAESTIGNYVSALRRLTALLGERPEHAAIDLFIADMRRAGASYSHIKNTSQALEAYTLFLGNPIKLGRPKKPKRLLKGILSEAEVTLLIAATRNLRDRAILSLLAYSGIRNNELCSLLIQDVDIATQIIRVNGGKGDKDRTAWISGACAETLVTYLRERNGQSADRLFVTKRNKNQFEPQDLRKLVRDTALRAGIAKRVHPHLLRHSLATHLLDRGSGVFAIQRQLGHAFLETTMLYVHSDPIRMRAEYDFFTPSYM